MACLGNMMLKSVQCLYFPAKNASSSNLHPIQPLSHMGAHPCISALGASRICPACPPFSLAATVPGEGRHIGASSPCPIMKAQSSFKNREQADLIKQNLPFNKKINCLLLIEQLVFTAPPLLCFLLFLIPLLYYPWLGRGVI